MFCPNFKCGSPLSISTECEECGWKAHTKTTKPLAFQVEKAEKAARSAARRAESDAHKAERKATRIEGDILEVTKEQVEGGRSYEKKTVVTMTDGRKYELDSRFPSLNDKRTGELVESFSELDWVCVKEADVVEEAVEEEVYSTSNGKSIMECEMKKEAQEAAQKAIAHTIHRAKTCPNFWYYMADTQTLHLITAAHFEITGESLDKSDFPMPGKPRINMLQEKLDDIEGVLDGHLCEEEQLSAIQDIIYGN